MLKLLIIRHKILFLGSFFLINFQKLALISTFGLFLSSPSYANIYRIDLAYGDDPDPSENAGLSGFFVINTTLDTNNDRFTSLGSVTVPNWITQISLTYDPTPLNPSSGDEVTTTQFDRVVWTLSNPPNFNLQADFMDLNGDGNTSDAQFTHFGFVQQNDLEIPSFAYLANTPLDQHTRGGEFPLESTATTPGGLPLLGFGVLAYYYKRLKSNKYKL